MYIQMCVYIYIYIYNVFVCCIYVNVNNKHSPFAQSPCSPAADTARRPLICRSGGCSSHMSYICIYTHLFMCVPLSLSIYIYY